MDSGRGIKGLRIEIPVKCAVDSEHPKLNLRVYCIMDLGMGFEKFEGTGVIGLGMLFHGGKIETPGRSESSPVALSNAKDYCKQPIVFYYLSEQCA